MLPEIRSATDITFSHFGPFFAILTLKIKIWKKCKQKTWRYYPFTHVYHKWRSYEVWFLRYKARQIEFFVMLGHFLPLILLATQKIKILKNWKKCLEIFFYTCTINENHVMYSSWNMERNRQNFFSFWTIFCPFTILTTRKKIFEKKRKKCLEISSLHTSVPYMTHTSCMIPEIWSVTQFFVILSHFLPFYNTDNPKTQIFKKMKKNPKDIIILHMCSKNYDQMM